MAGAGVSADSMAGRREVGGTGSWIQYMRLSYKGWVTIIIMITRKALGERRPPPSSTVPPYNDSH